MGFKKVLSYWHDFNIGLLRKSCHNGATSELGFQESLVIMTRL